MEKCKERTLGSLKKDHEAFVQAGSKKEKAKHFNSVIKEAIIDCGQDDDVRVMDFCALPLLHVLLGVVNRTYNEMMSKLPEVSLWPQALHIHMEHYHGSSFEGNECKRLLDNIATLNDVLNRRQLRQIRPLIRVLEAFKEINSLVHQDVVDTTELRGAVEDFGTSWSSSGMSLTVKAHIIIDHVEDFVSSWGNANISRFSEQAHETAHSAFLKTWSKYRVKEVSNPRFQEKLKQAVLDFNGSHGF